MESYHYPGPPFPITQSTGDDALRAQHIASGSLFSLLMFGVLRDRCFAAATK